MGRGHRARVRARGRADRCGLIIGTEPGRGRQSGGGEKVPQPLTVAGDLRRPGGLRAIVQPRCERFERCDILVNNAGATRAGNFMELADETWLDGFALKFFGAVRLKRMFWPPLKASQGHVVNIIGGAARTVEPESLIGGSVNAATANFNKGLSQLGVRDGIHVNAIHPGTTATERTEQLLMQRAAARQAGQGTACSHAGQERSPSHGERRSIAALALFLCSERARHIQGTAIAVNGGRARAYIEGSRARARGAGTNYRGGKNCRSETFSGKDRFV